MALFVLSFWKARRGRRAAVAAILPQVEQSRRRLNGIPDAAWFDPYLVGFIVMLITTIAERECDLRDSPLLAHVQSAAWADITGLESDLIGEEVLLLSAARHKEFEHGCEDALAFAELLYCNVKYPGDYNYSGREEYTDSLGSGFGGAGAIEARNDVEPLPWAHYFDEHVTTLIKAAPSP